MELLAVAEPDVTQFEYLKYPPFCIDLFEIDYDYDDLYSGGLLTPCGGAGADCPGPVCADPVGCSPAPGCDS